MRPHAEPEEIESSSRMAGDVERWHVWPTLRRQSVAAHSWNVLRIYFEIWGPPEPDVFTWMLIHDCPEIRTGDVPFGGKGYMSKKQRESLADMEHSVVREQLPGREDEVHAAHYLTEDMRRRAKVCDLIDMLEFARIEQAMGNTLADGIASRIGHVLQQQIVRMPETDRNLAHAYLVRTGDRS